MNLSKQYFLKLIGVLFFILLLSNVGFSQTKAQPRKKSIPRPAAQNGSFLYNLHCESCHLKDGSGVPNLINNNLVKGDRKPLIDKLLQDVSSQQEEGLEIPIQMPAFDYLKDNEIAAILNYIRHSFGNRGSIITPFDVTKQRSIKNKK